MKYTRLRLIITSVILFSVCLLHGQTIAQVPSDPAVKSGTLPNGMKWYVVENQYIKGAADFALVQATGARTIPSIDRATLVSIAQESLQAQPLLTAPSVQNYFLGKGAIPGPGGFAEVGENATVFKFRNVNLRLSDSVADSTLLVLMNIASRAMRSDDLVLKKWYTPADQAIVVAGDVTAKTISEKIHMLSLMMPAVESVPREEYVWNETDARVEVSAEGNTSLSHISAQWRMERTPKEFMNTVQPAVLEKYMTMTGMVVRERLLKRFKKLNIPVASVECSYVSGEGMLGDACFSVDVLLGGEHVFQATEVMASVLSSVDAKNVQVAEAAKASLMFEDAVSEQHSGADVSNAEYVGRCVAAFIYKTSLPSRNDIRKFYVSKYLTDEQEKDLMCKVASASLDVNRNLVLSCTCSRGDVKADSLKSVFEAAWQREQDAAALPEVYQNAPHLPVTEAKAMVRSIKKEYVSGGSVITLTNGIRVMYGNMTPDSDDVYYSLSLNGGAGNVEGLETSDGRYLADYFATCRIGGVTAGEFKDAIRRKDMTFNCEVGHSSTRFYGKVRKDRLEYMFRVLLAAMNEREGDPAGWEYYMSGEHLRQLAGNASGSGKGIDGEFPQKADAFFNKLSQNVNNGVFILMGDVDERMLKKAVVANAAGFRTTERSFVRTETFNRNFTGLKESRKESAAKGVTALLTAPMAMSAENYYTAAIAAMTLRRHLAGMLAEKGVRASVEFSCNRYPQESVVMKVTVEEAATEGLASGTREFNPEEATAILQRLFADMSVVELNKDILSSYKYRVERHLLQRKNDPEYWVEALNLRYLDGKDFTTSAEARIKSITEKNVRAMLNTLGNSSEKVFTIKGK
jgi:predicted Zn-dependent peptidase